MTRRRHILALTTVLLIGLTASTHAWRYLAFEQIPVDNTAGGKSFTAAKISPAGSPQAQYATCRLETAQIRYTYDGTTVTSSVGVLWEVGEEKTFVGHDVLDQFRAIRTGASSGQLDCNYAAQ